MSRLPGTPSVPGLPPESRHDSKDDRSIVGWLLALPPGAFALALLSLVPSLASGRTFSSSLEWVPSLGISLSFHIDGLSLAFALLISGIGALVMIYTGGYMAGHPHLMRLYGLLYLFMASMLGLVLSSNLISLFVFWELTSISSYLLIGFGHKKGESRRAALQALLVTGGGGLALLAGLVLMGQAAGSYDMSQVLASGEALRQHSLYMPILLLVLAGAFTKSAQFPFHFWLPGAMAAPTPVSAYLHSATMVKAGIYLLARLNPALGGSEAWHYLITLVGAGTMLAGAVLAFPQKDLKKLLAYSTVSALGTLTLLIGLNTSLSMKAAMVFLLVHSLYKGALFLTAGNIDHASGTRDVSKLGGLARLMPLTAAAAGLSALSMAGLPPLFGFISKELLYEAKMQAPTAAGLITTVGIAANMILVGLAGILIAVLLRGNGDRSPRVAREVPFAMLAGPCLLTLLSLLTGLFPDLASPLVSPAVSAIRAETTEIHLALWHGFNPVLALGFLTYTGGVGLFFLRRPVVRFGRLFSPIKAAGPESLYERGLSALTRLAALQTRLIQSGYLRFYLLAIVGTTVGLLSVAYLSRHPLPSIAFQEPIRFQDAVLAGLILAAALAAAISRSRLGSIAALGAVGYLVAMVFVRFGAPDLAMTQILIETLTVILFVFVFYRLPRYGRLTSPAGRARDAVAALATGAVMTVLTLAAAAYSHELRLSEFFAENSWSLGHGRNVVNVILVDFRALDTLGEIVVLALAGLGVYALLKLRPKRSDD